MPNQTELADSGSAANALAAPWLFLLGWAVALAPFGRFAAALAKLSLRDERYTHLILIPFISVGIIFLERRRIFLYRRSAPALGLPLLAFGAILFLASGGWSLAGTDGGNLWLPGLALVLVWVAIFLAWNGPISAWAAAFPLGFLLFAVPLPPNLLDQAVRGLQTGSAAVTQFLFRLAGLPFLRSGFRFELPGVTIEVAEECSGIRSTMALLIAGTLAAQFALRSVPGKLAFCLLTFPVSLVRNGVRIAALSWLSVYVDPAFLQGNLHHRGGAVFALVGLILLFPVLLLIRRAEGWGRSKGKTSSGAAPGLTASV